MVQVGATPEGVEVPLAATDAALQEMIAQQPANNRASPLAHPDPSDPKWRFMWRLGPRPATTAFAELNADPVVPAGACAFILPMQKLCICGLDLCAVESTDRMLYWTDQMLTASVCPPYSTLRANV